jgi:hypothetical protein
LHELTPYVRSPGTQGHVPDSEVKLRQELETTRHRLAEAQQEISGLKESVEAFARVVNLLTVQNDQLIRQRHQARPAHLTSVRPETNRPRPEPHINPLGDA